MPDTDRLALTAEGSRIWSDVHRAMRQEGVSEEHATAQADIVRGEFEKRAQGVRVGDPPPPADGLLSFAGLAATNRARCESPDGFGHPLSGWSLSDWLLAATGEFGEAANVAKKLNRVRDGIPGNTRTPDELRSDLADEFADAIIYLDLAAQSQGIDLGTAVVSKFNRTSERIGAPHRLGDQPPPADDVPTEAQVTLIQSYMRGIAELRREKDWLRAALGDIADWLEAEADHPRPDPVPAMRLCARQARAALAAQPAPTLDRERLARAIYAVSVRHDWAHTTDTEDRTDEIADAYEADDA